jgi:transposase InsO family protein
MKQVPIRTSFDKTVAPGFLEVDLVGHDGGLARGEFCYTLTLTDPATGWTWVKGLLNKAQRWVILAMAEAIEDYRLPVRGIHSDSGSEFINRYFMEFCRSRGIEFTRSRPGRKNDNCHVEQKNDAVVRNTVGYFRLSGPKDLKRLNEVYVWENQSVNFLEPSMKLKEKVRVGSKI